MSERQRFQNKVIIVTGAAQGIGRGVALQAAAEGAQVVLADLSAYVEDVLAEILAAGGDAVTIQADLADPKQLKKATEKIIKTQSAHLLETTLSTLKTSKSSREFVFSVIKENLSLENELAEYRAEAMSALAQIKKITGAEI